MVNFGMFHLLDEARTANFDAAVSYLLQQPWVVFSCQIQKATDKQLKVSTLQFATEGGEVYIFDCLALGVQAIHEHGLAWLLQSPTLKKIMYSSDNTAAALWRQLRVQVVNAVDLQALTTPPTQWPSFDKANTDASSDMYTNFTDFSESTLARSGPMAISRQKPKFSALLTPPSTSNLHRAGQKTHHVSVDANSQKSGRAGQESPQAVLDLMLDELESDALSSPCNIVHHFTSEPPPPRPSVQRSGPPKQGRGRCSSMGSMSLLDSMQLMELPILPGQQCYLPPVSSACKHYSLCARCTCLMHAAWHSGLAVPVAHGCSVRLACCMCLLMYNSCIEHKSLLAKTCQSCRLHATCCVALCIDCAFTT